MPSAHVPIYVAALGPNNLRLTGELADGWIGNSFFPETADVFFDPIREGATHAGRAFDDLDLTVAVGLEFTDDVEAAGRRHAEGYTFTFGAMGSATTNFYNNAFERQGYGDDVREVQRLWFAGDKKAARERVPIEIGLGTNLIGTDDLVRERLRLIAMPESPPFASGSKATCTRASTRPSATSPICSNSSLTSTAEHRRQVAPCSADPRQEIVPESSRESGSALIAVRPAITASPQNATVQRRS